MVTPLPATAVIQAAALAGGLFSLVAIVALVVMLVVREFSGAEVGGERGPPRLRFLVATLNAPILALLAVFIVTVTVRVLEVLG